MTDPDNPEKNSAEVDRILSEFDSIEDTLGQLCAKTKSLIEASLQDANIQYQSVQSRVKSKKKVKEKYLDPEKQYEKLSDITDLAGLRVITYYEDDVDRVSQVLKREFNIDAKNSVDKRDVEPDRFGYNALNYVCGHLEKRIADVEYKKFAGIRCEVQVTSILRHAWAEMEHEWYDLKKSYPRNVKRRFYRIAALLELAESEFLDIKNNRILYEKSVAVRVEAKVPDLPVDAVSLRAFIEQDPVVGEIDESLGALLGKKVQNHIPEVSVILRSRLANRCGLKNMQELRDSLNLHKNSIPEFVRRCMSGLWPPQNPNSLISRGVCIHHLTMLLASLRGIRETTEFLAKFAGKPPAWDIARQVTIAEEVVAKHSK